MWLEMISGKFLPSSVYMWLCLDLKEMLGEYAGEVWV